MIKNILILSLLIVSLNASFLKHASVEVDLVQKGSEKQWCPICGMSIKKYWKTSHASTLKNGTKRQYCSIRCLAVDKEEHNIQTDSIFVVDVKTQKLIYASKAFYIVNSKIKGTMSKVSKLAFKNKSDAIEFKKKYQGELLDFHSTFHLVVKSLDKDIAVRNKKLNKKIYPMGKKIFEHRCSKDIDLLSYIEINSLKAAIIKNNLCKNLNPKQLQVVSLYLWDIKRKNISDSNLEIIKVDKTQKCPVCGMFVYKYPRWAAKLYYIKDNVEHNHAFDGVKDLLKFYFNPSKWGKYDISNISKIDVTDYYTQNAIDAKKAFYVLRSDIYGPMGEELIPFKNQDDAVVFKKEHHGKFILEFKDIKEKDVYALDE